MAFHPIDRETDSLLPPSMQEWSPEAHLARCVVEVVEGISPVETMQHMLKTRAGRAIHALCKQTVEPVFGIIKSVMDFRQFLLRG